MNGIENYALYGETDEPLHREILHCETLRSRAIVHNWRFRPHMHNGMHQFFWIASGEGVASIDGARLRINAGTALSLPQLTVHGFDFRPEIDGWVVTIPTANLARILDNSNPLMLRLQASAIFRTEDSAEPLFSQIASEFNRFSEEREQALTFLAGLLAVWFSRGIAASADFAPVSADRGRDLLARFIQMIEDHLHEHRPVAKYASALSVTPTHLSRICRRIARRSASALIQDRLALESRRELSYTAKPVSEIAYALGFGDPSHFSKFFRKQTGLSPSRFRAVVLKQAATPGPKA